MDDSNDTHCYLQSVNDTVTLGVPTHGIRRSGRWANQTVIAEDGAALFTDLRKGSGQ